MVFEQSPFLCVASTSNDSTYQHPFQMQYSWSDISKQEVNLMMTHEPQTLQSYIGSNSMMMDVNMNLPLNVTITPKNVKSEAKIPILGPSGKPKRIRTNFTSEQLISLENCFTNQQYLTRGGRIHISKELNLSERQVKIWFQNRRMKLKKDTQNKSKTTKTNQQNSDGESRPSSNGSAASHRSSSNDQEIRNNLMKYQSYGFPNGSSPQQSLNHGSRIQVVCPSQVAVPRKITSVHNAGLPFAAQPWKPVQFQSIDEPMIIAHQPPLPHKIHSETIPNLQNANNSQAAELDEGLQIDTPELKLLDNLFQIESPHNVAQQVLIDNNDTSFNAFNDFFDNILSTEPTNALSDSITDDWNFKSELLEL